MGSYVSSFFESLSGSYESLFGSSAAVPSPAPSASQPKSSYFWDNYSKEELKQLGLTRRYLFMQEEHLRTVVPALAKEIWLIIGDSNSHLAPSSYPTGSPSEAVERAYSNPVAYLAGIPSANAFAKKLYDQAKVADHRIRNGQKISQDEALAQAGKQYVRQTLATQVAHRKQQQHNQVANMQAKMRQAAAARRPQFGRHRPAEARTSRAPEPCAPAQKAPVAAITLRLRSLCSEGGCWPHLEAEYKNRRDGIYGALGGYEWTRRSELEAKPFGLNSAQAASPERPRHELFSLLLIIERNWKLVLGLLIELLGLMAVAENPDPLIGWDYLRALGPNKIAKQTLEEAFGRAIFNWIVVKIELGLSGV